MNELLCLWAIWQILDAALVFEDRYYTPLQAYNELILRSTESNSFSSLWDLNGAIPLYRKISSLSPTCCHYTTPQLFWCKMVEAYTRYSMLFRVTNPTRHSTNSLVEHGGTAPPLLHCKCSVLPSITNAPLNSVCILFLGCSVLSEVRLTHEASAYTRFARRKHFLENVRKE